MESEKGVGIPAVQWTFISCSLLSVFDDNNQFSISQDQQTRESIRLAFGTPWFCSASQTLLLRFCRSQSSPKIWNFKIQSKPLIIIWQMTTWKQSDCICLSQLSRTCLLSKCTTQSIWENSHERDLSSQLKKSMESCFSRFGLYGYCTWSICPCILPSVIILLAMRSALFCGISKSRPSQGKILSLRIILASSNLGPQK